MRFVTVATALLASGMIGPGGQAQTASTTISKEERIEPTDKQLALLQALTPADFQRTAVVSDSDLDTVAMIDTSQGYKNRGRFTDRVRADNFLRAIITKRTGVVHFQVYQSVNYNYEARNFTSVNYSTPDGPQSAPLTNIAHEVVGCNYGVCSYSDDVGFDVPEDLLRAIAATYVPGASPFWRFKFNAQNGINWEDRMAPAEVAGLLAAVDAYRTAHPVRR